MATLEQLIGTPLHLLPEEELEELVGHWRKVREAEAERARSPKRRRKAAPVAELPLEATE